MAGQSPTRRRTRPPAAHRTRVKATGRLQDPTDMAFNEDHLDNPEALTGRASSRAAPHPGQWVRAVPPGCLKIGGKPRTQFG